MGERKHEADRAVFDDYLRAIEHLEERLCAIEITIEATSHREPYREPVAWLRCFRGIDTVTAMSLVAELHDFGALPVGSRADVVPGAGAERELHRRSSATRGDHEDGQQAGAAAAHRGLVALSAQARCWEEAAQAPRGTTGLGDRRRGSRAGAAAPEILETGHAREGSQQGRDGGGARAQRLSLGGAARA